MTIRFTVSEKLVKARDGAGFDLGKYQAGVDYVVRKAFKGERRMFRKGILDGISQSHVNMIEHKDDSCDMAPVKADVSLDLVHARVTKLHLNRRYVETDVAGRVFCGAKGSLMRLNQQIRVKGGCLYLGK